MNFANFLTEFTNPDFDVSVDFGDGKFARAGSFHSEQAAKREGRQLCTLDGNGKKYKVTNNVTGKAKTYSATSAELNEGEESYVAASAYKVNVAKVQEQLALLNQHIEKHQKEYAGTDQQNWAYSGDMARLAKELSAINEWMNNEVNF